jgi:pimeloyl-ACP methyl ester carboxylesterase
MSNTPEGVVLIPDILCDACLFGPILQPLAANRPVTLAPATGADSSAVMAQALLTRLPDRFALVGQGLGGVIAMDIAQRAPDRITRLALIATYPFAETPVTAADREPRIASARAGRMDVAAEAEFPADTLAPGMGRANVQRTLDAMAGRMPAETYVRQSRALQRRPDHQGTLRRLQVPVLVLCGAHDTLAPPRRQQIVADLIRGATLTVLDDAGHMPTLEAPQALLQAVDAWLVA